MASSPVRGILRIFATKYELLDPKSNIELFKEAKALNVQIETCMKTSDKLIAPVTLECNAQPG
ncbi:MAG: hypothetical protein HGB22_02785 [Chlorobiaceae bacterium]|nr:hypothetical protein [Chlorobiaceae bacterium]